MTHYLIEFRFLGPAKHEIRRLIHTIDSTFNLKLKKKFRTVPHITLAGPMITGDEAKLVNDFWETCSRFPPMDFTISGYGYFQKNMVIFINVVPGEQLKQFRRKLARKIVDYCKLSPYDHPEEYNFHCTIAMKLDLRTFQEIIKYISRLETPRFNYYLLRTTLLRNSKILYEYDFILRRLLTREEALSGAVYRQTITGLRKFLHRKLV